MLPAEVIAKLNECAKTDFGSIRDLWFGRLSLSTDFVVAGLALEVFELAYETADIARERIRFLKYRVVILERHIQIARLIAFVGWFLIVGGVAGERFSEARVKNADVNIQECSDAKVREATLEAGDAKASAASAEASEKALEKQADALKTRMEDASRQLGQLERDIMAQGPRWRLLKKAAPELTKNLASFTGQRVRLFVCGRFGSQDGETLSTWGAIADMLEANGAKWKVEHGGLENFDKCSPSGGQPLGQGVMVFVSKRASKATMEAAKTLGEGLAKALPPSPDKMPALIDPEFAHRMRETAKRLNMPEDKDSPWGMVADDPDLITVLIGAHPQQ